MALTPIARWDVVPHQRIAYGSTFKAGVVAFTEGNVEKVTFSVNGGTGHDVTSCTYNDLTDVWEWWYPVPSNHADISANGVVTLDATVTGNDTGTRVLDQIEVVVDYDGTYPVVEAWVSLAGNDTTGEVGNQAKPFASLGQAATAIQTYRNGQGYGADTSGAYIYLSAGQHVWSHGGYTTNITPGDEWLTVTHAAGVTRAEVEISYDQAPITYARVYDVTLKRWAAAAGVSVASFSATGSKCWLDNCIGDGQDRYSSSSNYPVKTYGDVYFTDWTASGYQFPTRSAVFVRNATITATSDNVLENCPVCINVTADDNDPGPWSNSVAGEFTSPSTLVRSDGKSFLDRGFYAGMQCYLDNQPENEGQAPFTIASVTDSTIVCEEATIVNAVDSNFDIGYTTWHSDLFQLGAAVADNIILYNIKGTDLNYTGIFCGDPQPDSQQGMAFVNVAIANAISQYRSMDQYLMLHVTQHGSDIEDVDYTTEMASVTYPMDSPDMSVRNSAFNVVKQSGAPTEIDWAGWDYNRYGTDAGATTHVDGANSTVGELGVDANGSPEAGSALLAACPRLSDVPADIDGKARDATTAIGAYRGPAEGEGVDWFPTRGRCRAQARIA